MTVLPFLLLLLVAATEATYKPNPHMVPFDKKFSPAIKFLMQQYMDTGGLPRSYKDVLPDGENYWGSETYVRVGAIDWEGNKVAIDSEIASQERTLTNTGLNLYDAATWQIAVSLWGAWGFAESYERNILYTGTTGTGYAMDITKGGLPAHLPGVRAGLLNIRADGDGMKYGDKLIPGDMLKSIPYPGNATHFPQNPTNGMPKAPVKAGPGSFFFRMIGPFYYMKDPLNGEFANAWKDPWPVTDPTTTWNSAGYLHWNDWKPITGENVWSAMIGPLQTLSIKTGGNMTNTTCGQPEHPIACDFKTYDTTPPAVQLGITIVPALEALLSPLGSLYHCPKGALIYPPDPHEGSNVSNENNFSAYAAIKMLNSVLEKYAATSSDEYLTYGRETTTKILKAMDGWFAKYLLSPPGELPNGRRLVYQGGHVINGKFLPAKLDKVGGVAVDCQTWGLSVVGAKAFDGWYGAGASYNTWQAAKHFAGHYIDGKIAGVGYTDELKNNTVTPNTKIWSAEWSFGAVNMAQVLAGEYKAMGDMAKYTSLMDDAVSMLGFMTKPWPKGLQFSDGSYVYANARFFIPWGWYANPIGALCSTAWSVFQEQEFNPFVLGGGDKPKIKEYIQWRKANPDV